VATSAALARAPMPPSPTVDGAVSNDTTLRWDDDPAVATYVVRWRRTDAAQWENEQTVQAGTCNFTITSGGEFLGVFCEAVLPHVRIDDWIFGVSSVAPDGSESPVASAVPGGAFRPYVAPPQPPAQ